MNDDPEMSATPVCVGLLVEEEEEVSVSKISRREKGVGIVRSFVYL